MLRVGVAKYSNKFDIISLAYYYLCNMVAKILTLSKRKYYSHEDKLFPSRRENITLARVMYSPREGRADASEIPLFVQHLRQDFIVPSCRLSFSLETSLF